ncbi:MAG: hypothetical protein HRF43_20845 [Phycisphaerae bacterium]|jgi:hypothetical protein
MMKISRISWVLLGALVLGLVSGCPLGGTYGCGTILNVALKVGLQGNVGSLSACEWRTLYADIPGLASALGVDLSGITLPELSAEQAQEIVDFLAAYDLRTIADIEAAFASGEITEADLPEALLEFYTEFVRLN